MNHSTDQDLRQVAEELVREWEQKASELHDGEEGANPDDMGEFSRARWFALRECAQALRTALAVPPPNPWLELAGSAADDPRWEEYQAAIRDCREGKIIDSRWSPVTDTEPPVAETVNLYRLGANDCLTGWRCGAGKWWAVQPDTTAGRPISKPDFYAPIPALPETRPEVTFPVKNIVSCEVAEQERVLYARLAQLADTDTTYLLAEDQKIRVNPTHPRTPALYASGVELRALASDVVFDIPTVLKHRVADIDALVCWRVAELRRDGVAAEPIIVKIKREFGTVWTCRVKMPDGTIENVQEKLRS